MIGIALRATTIGLAFVSVTQCSRSPHGTPATTDAQNLSAAPLAPASATAQVSVGFDGGRTYDHPTTLYAHHAAELHAGAAEGPVIGRVLRGATIVTASPGSAGHVSFALPGFTNGVLADSGVSPAIIAFAPAEAFGSQAVALEGPEPEGRIVEDFPPGVEMASAPGAEPFAVTRCGDIRVLEVQEQRSRISQYHAGFELSGWVSAPIEVSRGPVRCKLRVVYRRGSKLIAREGISADDEREVSDVPPGYVRADNQEVLLDLIDNGKTVYWLTRTKTMGARCSAWRFDPRARPGAAAATDEVMGRLTGRPMMRGKARVVPSYDWEYKLPKMGRPGELLLQGPHFQTPPGAPLAGYRCSTANTISGKAEHAIRIFPGDWSPERVAWHPDDEEKWFDSRETCEQVARAAEPILKSGGTQPPGGFHISCSGEFE